MPASTFGHFREMDLEIPDDAPNPMFGDPRNPIPSARPQARPPIASLEQPIDLVVFVATHGNEQTIAAALTMLPDPLHCAVILAVSDAASATGAIPDLLSLACLHGITEAGHEEILIPGHVWVSPLGRVLSLARRGNAVHTLLLEPAAIHGHGAIDVLLGSAAASFGKRTLAVILDGDSNDGLEGCSLIKAAGGRIIQSAPEPGDHARLPVALADARIAHGIWPLAELGSIVRDCILHGRHDRRRPATT